MFLAHPHPCLAQQLNPSISNSPVSLPLEVKYCWRYLLCLYLVCSSYVVLSLYNHKHYARLPCKSPLLHALPSQSQCLAMLHMANSHNSEAIKQYVLCPLSATLSCAAGCRNGCRSAWLLLLLMHLLLKCCHAWPQQHALCCSSSILLFLCLLFAISNRQASFTCIHLLLIKCYIFAAGEGRDKRLVDIAKCDAQAEALLQQAEALPLTLVCLYLWNIALKRGVSQDGQSKQYTQAVVAVHLCIVHVARHVTYHGVQSYKLHLLGSTVLQRL